MLQLRFKTISLLSFIRGMAGLCIVALLPACASGGYGDASYPESRDDAYQKKIGSLASDEGGFTLFDSNSKKENGGGAGGGGLGVNGFLWRAALDTVSFMPIVSADPIGGLIITDWYSPPGTPNERIKMNIYILDRDLRADGVRVTVFRQQKSASGAWQDAPVGATTQVSLENTVLSKARQLRVAYESTAGK